MKTIAFLCLSNLSQFIDPIAEELKKDPNYKVIKCYSNQPVRLHNAIEEADIVWLEWANELAIQVTTNKNVFKLEGKQVICRVHSYEVLSKMIEQIDWSVITDVVFVAEHIQAFAAERIQKSNQTIHPYIIPNGVDLDKFSIAPNKTFTGNICFCGYINYKKSPELLMQAFKAIRNQNNVVGMDYRLHVAGEFQDPRHLYYMEHITNKMGLVECSKFHGWVKDMNAFYADMDYVIVASPWESQHMACMEAMACGVQPLVHNFVGSGNIYSPEHIWTTIDDLVRMVTEAPDNTYENNRKFIEDNFGLEKEMSSLKALFNSAPKKQSKPKGIVVPKLKKRKRGKI